VKSRFIALGLAMLFLAAGTDRSEAAHQAPLSVGTDASPVPAASATPAGDASPSEPEPPNATPTASPLQPVRRPKRSTPPPGFRTAPPDPARNARSTPPPGFRTAAPDSKPYRRMTPRPGFRTAPPDRLPNARATPPPGFRTAPPDPLPNARATPPPGFATAPPERRPDPRVTPFRPPSPKVTPVVAPPPPARPSAVPAPEAPAVPTAIPTARPTPRSIAPEQPTVPDSNDDPRVQGIIRRPIRELAQIGWMAGTWNARSVEERGDGTTRNRGTTTYVFSPTMKGRYFFGADGKARDYIFITFDPFARHWVLVRFEGNPSYGIWISDGGWKGNRIEFLSNFSFANGRQYRRRLTIIHKDPRTFGIYNEEQLPTGGWTPDDAVELTKQ